MGRHGRPDGCIGVGMCDVPMSDEKANPHKQNVHVKFTPVICPQCRAPGVEELMGRERPECMCRKCGYEGEI